LDRQAARVKEHAFAHQGYFAGRFRMPVAGNDAARGELTAAIDGQEGPHADPLEVGFVQYLAGIAVGFGTPLGPVPEILGRLVARRQVDQRHCGMLDLAEVETIVTDPRIYGAG